MESKQRTRSMILWIRQYAPIAPISFHALNIFCQLHQQSRLPALWKFEILVPLQNPETWFQQYEQSRMCVCVRVRISSWHMTIGWCLCLRVELIKHHVVGHDTAPFMTHPRFFVVSQVSLAHILDTGPFVSPHRSIWLITR